MNLKKHIWTFYFVINSILLPTLKTGFCQIKNKPLWPDIQGKHINAHGGSVKCFAGIYYWYGGHKIEDLGGVKCSFIDQIPQQEYIGGLANAGVHCYSSVDLENWKDEGIVLEVNFKNEEGTLPYGSIIERPKVLYNTDSEQFIMHFKLKLKQKDELFARHGSPMYYGVAVSNNPRGPFRYSHKYLTGFSDEGGGDHTIFVDDNKGAYLFFSAKPGLIMYYVKLSDNYLRPTGKALPCKGMEPRFEAPAMFKVNETYHLLGSGVKGWNPTPPKYAIASSIEGPWKEIKPSDGIIKSEKINPNTNMGGEMTFGGQCTFVIELEGKKNAFIVMYDVWNPLEQYKSTYFWLPVEYGANNNPYIRWYDHFEPDEVEIVPDYPRRQTYRQND